MNKKILTYGLSDNHNAILVKELPECEVVDVTSAFTDLIAIPAVAVVINLKAMSAEEIEAFTEVFHADLDTCICCVGESEEVPAEKLAFMHVQETRDDLVDSLVAIRECLKLPAELEVAKLRKQTLIDRINSILSPDSDVSLRSQIAHIENTCAALECMSRILETREELKLREKVPYRVNMNSVLFAFMIAHELMDEDEIKDSALPVGLKKDWILTMAEDIRNNYELDVMLNGGIRG